MFYLVCDNLEQRSALIAYLKKNDIYAVFHYLSLHSSPYYSSRHDGRTLPNSDRFMDTLVRLPLYNGLTKEKVEYIIEKIKEFYRA